ncbi:hypothetical protein NLG97_g4683 [Lecanicillium saksenae]|uniref:Uncharacterized protein n=1 Tax=Lecanicillium saksenae TaxID=468837 RepID=A0ACC1QUL3_9HYPO|nr:hypothetical protein NLG97_g4683 [Lecanicillium saksenae]
MVKFTSVIALAFAGIIAAAPTNSYPHYGRTGDFEAANEKRTNSYPHYGLTGDFEAANEKRTNSYPHYGLTGDFEALEPGAVGLVTVKNLVEEGFDVTGFEASGYIGGVWHYTEEDKTSVLKTTVVNISKERGCFTDYEFPESVPSHASAADVQRYLESYAQHFDLEKRFRLNTRISKVSYNISTGKWDIEIEGSAVQTFDKVVVSTGPTSHPNMPKIQHSELFTGDFIHSRAFKKPELFKGKRVLLIGLGNTTADTVEALREYAAAIYISHSKGVCILPRRDKAGIPSDHSMTLRIFNFLGFLDQYFPRLSEYMLNKIVIKKQNERFTIRPEYRLSPALSVKSGAVIISDNLIENFENGVVTSVPATKSIIDGKTVELADGTRIEVDSIICCTGYRKDFGIMDRDVDSTRHANQRWAAAEGSFGKPLPRLYQNIFSLDHPGSLAFTGCVAFVTGAFPLYDLISMVIAQVWSGKSELPPLEEMALSVDEHHDFACTRAEGGPTLVSWVKQGVWEPWAHKMAGTGISENLDWGWQGWKFWWNNRRFYNLLVNGIYSPFLFRVFDGKRKKWDGAKEAIERLNANTTT